MTVTATLTLSELMIEAGDERACEVVVRNTGDVVDQLTVDVVGATAGWATAVPDTVNLMPGDEQTVQVFFAPPRSAEVPCGVVPFAVRVRSREDPDGTTVQEGTVEIAPFTELTAQLVPPKRRGSYQARFRLAVENRGNVPVRCQAYGYHPDEQDVLDVKLAYTEFEATPGTTTTVKLRTVPARRFLRGEPVLHPFVVEVHGEAEPEPVLVDGVMIQQATVPPWLLKALLIAVVALVALVVLWYAVLVPKVQSIATEQVAPQVAAAQSAANQAGAEATTAGVAANTAAVGAHVADPVAAAAAGIPDPRTDGPSTGLPNAGGPTGTGTGPQTGSGAVGGSVNFRIATTAPPVTDGSFTPTSYTAPAGKGLGIGDIVLQNPRGDTGLLQIKFGDQVVLEVGLANFRDLDYHYIDPLLVDPGQPVVVAVSCGTPGPGANQCTPAVSFSAKAS